MFRLSRWRRGKEGCLIIIGLGANLPHPQYGPPEATLEAALEALENRGVRIVDRSAWYESPPYPPSLGLQPWYVNGAAAVATDFGPDRLLQVMHEVEWSFGRVRIERWAPRWIDLDLIAYGNLTTPVTGEPGHAALPHPRLAERAFVLLPLAEIAPDWRHPATGASVAEMIAAADRSGVARLDGADADEADADEKGLAARAGLR